MFYGATSFNQDISSWDLSSNNYCWCMFDDTPGSTCTIAGDCKSISCPPPPPPPTPLLPDMVQLSCDFEVDTCIWNDHTAPDGYTWTRMSGGTPSSGTGPSGDHTGSGYYLYTEASGKPYNKLHRLESPLFSLQQDATLSFFYHMRGSDYMGTLSVEVNNNETGWSTLWSRTGDQGNSWLDAAILLPASATQVRFNGKTGNGWRSDMALDDVSFSQFAPPSPPPPPPSPPPPSASPSPPPPSASPSPPPPSPPPAGVVTTLAGSDTSGSADGTGTAASFNRPRGVAVSGGTLYVADFSNHRIRKIDALPTCFAFGEGSEFNAGYGACSTYVAGQTNNGYCTIDVMTVGNKDVTAAEACSECGVCGDGTAATTLAGSGALGSADGTGTAASFKYPFDVAVSPDGGTLYVGDTSNNRIRKIDTSNGVTTTLAGSGTEGSADGTGTAASFNQPHGVAVSPDGGTVYVGDLAKNRIRKIDTSGGVTTTLAGSVTGGSADGTGTAASFNSPYGVAVSPDGGTVYVADTYNARIRKIDTSDGVTSTLAGSTYGFADGTGTAASFDLPHGVAVSPDGGTVYVADTANHRIRKIDTSDGATTTLAGSDTSGSADGTGTAASFKEPTGVAVSPDGGTVYVAGNRDNRIRQVTT